MKADSLAPIKEGSSAYQHLKHFAVISGQLAMVQLLVDYGAKIIDDANAYYATDKHGSAVIATAVHENHTDIARYLLAKGSTANYQYQPHNENLLTKELKKTITPL